MKNDINKLNTFFVNKQNRYKELYPDSRFTIYSGKNRQKIISNINNGIKPPFTTSKEWWSLGRKIKKGSTPLGLTRIQYKLLDDGQKKKYFSNFFVYGINQTKKLTKHELKQYNVNLKYMEE